MRLATWNVNSIRARVVRTVDFAVRENIDVLAMQEIKCKPEQFPHDLFRGLVPYHGHGHLSPRYVALGAHAGPDVLGVLSADVLPRVQIRRPKVAARRDSAR